MNTLVTGGNGFVGRALCEHLSGTGYAVRAAVRRQPEVSLPYSSIVNAGLLPETDWLPALKGIEVVVHLAARVHVMDEKAGDPLVAFRAVNVDGTRKLAEDALAAGVRRLIYVSSVKANGEYTLPGRPFIEAQEAPVDPYGISKLEAEQMLMTLGRERGLDIVVIRPPLIYGPGVKANFLRLMQLVAKGMPLPFACVHNKRSLLGLSNLIDLLQCCMSHPDAAGRVFLASDGNDLSTQELVRSLAEVLDVRPRLLPIPVCAMKVAAGMLGRQAAMQRLVGSLQVDISLAETVLGWKPQFSTEEEMRKLADWFRDLA